jgi:ribose 5-phosphate isomerase B
MGERVVGIGPALEILEVFLKTEFEGGRHRARVEQIDGLFEEYKVGKPAPPGI